MRTNLLNTPCQSGIFAPEAPAGLDGTQRERPQSRTREATKASVQTATTYFCFPLELLECINLLSCRDPAEFRSRARLQTARGDGCSLPRVSARARRVATTTTSTRLPSKESTRAIKVVVATSSSRSAAIPNKTPALAGCSRLGSMLLRGQRQGIRRTRQLPHGLPFRRMKGHPGQDLLTNQPLELERKENR